MADELLGDAILELGADWDPLRRELTAAGAYTRTKMEEMARSTGQFQHSLDALGSSLRNFTQGGAQVNAVTASTRQLIDSYRGLTGAVRQYELAARDSARQTQDLGAKLEAARRTIGLTTTQIDLMTKAIGLAKTEFHEWTVEINETVEAVGDLNSAVGEFINLHQRVKSLGPMLSPEDRQAIIAAPAYQGLMRTAAPPGERGTSAGALPPEVAQQLVENINIGRRLESQILQMLQEREYSIIGGGRFREGEGGARGRGPRPELPPAPTMGREFFDQLGQEMERVMAPVRRAWAEGINVQSLQAEATQQAVKQEKEAVDAIKSFVAQAIQEGAGPESEVTPEVAFEAAIEQALEPLGTKVEENTSALLMTKDAIDRIQVSPQGQSMMARMYPERYGVIPPSAVASGSAGAVRLLGGAKSPESPVNANNPLPVGIERPSDTGLASRAANIEQPTVQQIQAAPAGTSQAVTTGASGAPEPIARVPSGQAQAQLTPGEVLSALTQRQALLESLRRGGRAPYVSRYTPGMTPGAYEQITGTPYGTPARSLPIPATEPVTPGQPAELARGSGRDVVAYIERMMRGGAEPTPAQIAGMLASAAVREAIVEDIRALESGPLAAGGAGRRAIRPMPRSGMEYRYLDTPGRLRPGLARAMGGAPGEGYLSQATAQEFEHYLRMLAEPHQVPLAGRGFTMPGRAGQPTTQDIWDYILAHEPHQLGAGYRPPSGQRQLPRGQGYRRPPDYRYGPTRESVSPGAEVVPHLPEEQDAIRNYGHMIALLHAYAQMHTEEPPRNFSQNVADLFRMAQAYEAAGEAAARARGRVRPGQAGLPRYAQAGGRQYAEPQVVEEQPIIEPIAGGPGGGSRLPPIMGGGGDGGGGGGGFWSKLLWGGGSRIGIPFTGAALTGAGMGSLASLAGLGPEHLLMTLLGIGGFGAAGLAGAGTIAAGAAGATAVGGGADIAVLKSTVTDTQAIAQNYQAMQSAVQTYGAHSAQAALAQSTLNQQLLDLSGGGNKVGIGVLAEKQLAKNALALDQLFDKTTQGARVQASNILEQGVTLGKDFTPRVAAAAQQNLTIINNSIKPLFSWLEGPQGVKIFNDLENVFKRNLPTAVHAFSQAVEVLLKFVDAASSHTGGFTKHLDEFLTKLNDRSSGYFVGLVDKLVGDFRMWETLIKLVYQDLKLIFTQNAGAGRDIVGALDGMLANLHSWLETSKGQGQLHTVFETHKNEVLALLKTLPTLISDFGHFYLNVSPPLTKALTGIVTALGTILTDVSSISPQFATFVGGMMVMQKLGVLTPVLRGLSNAMKDTASSTKLLNDASTGGGGPVAYRNIAGDVKKAEGEFGAGGLPAGFTRTVEKDVTTMAEGDLKAIQADLLKAGPGAYKTTGGGPLSWLPGGIGAGKKQTWMINKDGNLVAVDAEEAGKGGMFSGTVADLTQRLKGWGLSETAAARFAPYLVGAGGAVVTGGAGYMAGTAIQRATGLRQGGTASAVGGIVGTAGGGLIGGLLTAGSPMGIMLGAGIGSGISTTLAPTITHLFSSLFGSGPGVNYGREFVKGFEKQLPGLAPMADVAVGPKQQEALVKSIEDTKNKAGKAWATYKDELSRINDPISNVYFGVQVSPDSRKATEKTLHDDYQHWRDLSNQGGQDAANYWITGFNSVKVPTTFAFETNALDVIKNQSTEPAKEGAASQVLAYAKQLEDSKQLPVDSVNKIIAAMEQQFPQLIPFLQRTGQQSDQALAEKFALTQTQSTLATTLKSIQTEFGLAWINPDVSGSNWTKNVGKNAQALQTIIQNSTGNTKTEAEQAFQELKQKTGAHLTAMVGDTKSKMGNVKALIAGGSQEAATQAQTHFTHFSDSVYTAMKSGAVSTATGMNLIQQMTNTVLKEFGVKNLSGQMAVNVEKQVLKFEGNQGSASGILHAALGPGGGSPGGGAFNVSSNALSIGNVGHEQGGLVQVGPPGARGQDTIPMNVGGMPIMVGAGEQVAVFNAHQQNVMNSRLADFGGLGGFFNTVNTPHSTYAQGGMVGSTDSGGYVFPFPKNIPFQWQRVDQGQDMQESPGSPVLAIGPGNVTRHSDVFGGFGPYYAWEQMSSGPLKGQSIYYGHIKTTRTGPVNAGTVIGVTQARANEWTAAPAGWLELGLTSALGHGIAQQGAAIAPLLHQLSSGARVSGGVFGDVIAPGQISQPHVVGGGALGQVAQAALTVATNAANRYIQGAAAAAAAASGGAPGGYVGGSLDQWLTTALKATGHFSAANLVALRGRAMQESSGNPHAINLWDSNAKAGHPSKGLLQTIDSTFNQYKIAGHSDIWNPIDNAMAAIRYMYATYGHIVGPSGSGYERGGFVRQNFRSGGQVKLTGTKPASEVDSTKSRHVTTPKAPTIRGVAIPKKAIKLGTKRLPMAHAPKGFKIIGAMPNDIAQPLAAINSDDTNITRLQNVLSLIQGEEGLWPMSAIVTPLDENGNPTDPVVNWGLPQGATPLGGAPLHFQPGAVGTQDWGMEDPASNTWQYGIDVRLGEIGPRGGLGGTSQDEQTELGIYNKILAKYENELPEAQLAYTAGQKHMNKLVTEVGWYKNGVFHSGLLQALVDRLTVAEKWMAPTKADVEEKLTARFRALTKQVQDKFGKKRYKGEVLRTIIIDDISEKQALKDANLPVKAPYNWVAAGMGTPSTGAQKAEYWWAQERAREVASITNTATEQRKAADLSAMNTYYHATIDQRQAMFGLDQEKADERIALNDYWAGKRITLQTQITNLKRQLTQDKSLLDTLTGQSAGGTGSDAGSLGTLKDMLDKKGSLQAVDIATLKDVNIPTLQKEIRDLRDTVPTQTSVGDTQALADLQNLADLQSQQLTIKAEQLAADATGFQVLTEALKSMPIFGGAFQTGGVVPGPLGEARTIIAHGGETVTPPQTPATQSTQPLRMVITMDDQTTRITLNDVQQVVQQSTGTASRHARRGLPGRAGGLGTR